MYAITFQQYDAKAAVAVAELVGSININMSVPKDTVKVKTDMVY
jgi:hypothetical protein